jgi:flagellar protein FliO/FliZ
VKLPARLILCGAVTLLLTIGAGAEENNPALLPPASAASHPVQGTSEVIIPTVPLTPNAPSVSSGSGIQLAIYLLLLVALLGVGSYFLKNGFSFLQPKNKGTRKLNVAETRMLGNRQFLVVAEYEGRRMLLGVCPGRIELLSELDSSKADESFAAHLSESR